MYIYFYVPIIVLLHSAMPRKKIKKKGKKISWRCTFVLFELAQGWYNLSCLLQTHSRSSIIEELFVSWQFSEPYGVTKLKYGSGWRTDVVNQCSECAVSFLATLHALLGRRRTHSQVWPTDRIAKHSLLSSVQPANNLCFDRRCTVYSVPVLAASVCGRVTHNDRERRASAISEGDWDPAGR